MAEIFNGTGIITKTSNDFCVLSVLIDGLSKSFLVYKSIFYTFGVQCDGSLRNILEEGMEVEFCYKISHPGNKLFILVVWLGNKPDVSSEDDFALKATYDKNGRVVSSVDNDNFLVQDDKYAVLINKEVVFRDGSPLEHNVVAEEEITFDAIPFDFEHPSGAAYQATCAWIGPKPKLVDRFKLRSLEEDSLEEDSGFSREERVHGTVAVIPNDVVALVDVEIESVLMKVLLFRNSLNRSCDRIQDVVDVGDRLCLRLGCGYIFPGRRQWFAIKAFRTSGEVDLDSDVTICQELSPEPDVKTETMTKSTAGSDLVEKPHVQSAENRLKNREFLYGTPPPSGVISGLPDDDCACITYEHFRIFVNRDNFYVNEKPCTHTDFKLYVAPGTNIVYFEAIKAKFSDAEKCRFTHEATCAWVGVKRPSARVVAESLPPPKISLLDEEGQIFYGIVCKFLFPGIGFVVIPGESTTVVMHVSNFVTPPQYPPESDSEKLTIAHYVKLNDYVEFTLRKSRDGLTACRVRQALFTKETWEKIKSGVSVSRGPCEKPEKSPLKDTIEGAPNTMVVNTVDLESPPSTTPAPSATSLLTITPFRNKCLSQNRGFLLNCTGTLKVKVVQKSIVAMIEHIFGTTTVTGCVDFFPTDIPLDSDRALKYNNSKLRFDAVCVMSPETNSGFRIVRMWRETDTRPASERLLVSELANWETDTRGCLFGKIKSIPLHDSAIAVVKNIPVLVTLNSLATSEEVNYNVSSIETFLNVGESIVIMSEKRDLEGIPYFRARRCLYSQGKSSSASELQVNAAEAATRSNIWGLGEYYRKERVLYEGGKYLVRFASSKRAGLELNLNLFEKNKVFIYGKLATPEMLKGYVGCEITFHVAHGHSEKLSSSGKWMFVACAWIGDEPPPKLIFEEVLAVPKGSICPCWRYEAIVRSFPLPFYALCYIGYVPVLVLILTPNQEEVLKDLRIGDRISISVCEEPNGDTAVVFSKDLKNLKKASEVAVSDVYKNLTGTVVALPEPVGKIKVAGADMEVRFELCHLRKFRKDPHLSFRKWFASVREKITVGKQVYFSATRSISNFKKVPYRAFEVYFME